MKIIFLTRLYFPKIGGVEKHVYEISKRLLKKGHKIVIITENNGWEERENIDGIEIIRINVGKNDWFKKFRIWREIWKLKTVLKTADIIHCHDVFFWILPYKLFLHDKKIFITFHGYENYPIRYTAIIHRKIAEKLTRGNICIGDFISKWYGTKPSLVSYGGVQKSYVGSTNNPKYTAIFWGRLDEQTSIKSYLNIVKIIQKNIKHFSLLIIGEGKYKKEVIKHAKVIGFTPDINRYLSISKYALASRYLSMLEAMISKKLVFAMYDNNLKKDYLLLSPFANHVIVKNNVNEMAEQIIYYINHPNEEKIKVENAYKWAAKQTWEKVVEKYIFLWNL